MSNVKLKIDGWVGYLRQLGDRAHVALQRGIVSGANRCIPLLQRRAETAPAASEHGGTGAVNTGDYRRRFRIRILERGAAVFNDHPAAGVIDRGRRVGVFPPLRAIKLWAQRRLGLDAKEAAAAAYPIARAIARRGLRPRNVQGGATAEMAAVVTEEAQRELAEELRR